MYCITNGGDLFLILQESQTWKSHHCIFFLTRIKFLNKEVFTPKTDLLMISSSKYPRDKLERVVLIWNIITY